jgi:isopentenyl diphosphate isomerase/L-lactate dehydrogenase-like FMN-dependent dehydrogenase
VERELRTALLLMGARDVAAAQSCPRLIRGELQRWATLA